MKGLYNENYESLKNEYIRKWKGIPCSWIGRINTVKMAVLQKAIDMFKAISINIPMTFFMKIKKSIPKFIWIHKRLQIAKAILRQKEK
jgi:hypothetical protein